MSIPPNRRDVKPRRKYESELRTAQAEATRRAIVDAALTTFLEYGYTGATMQKIADAAGVVVETIYRTFDGKTGLFRAAVEAAVAGGSLRADRPVEERPAIRAVIEEPDPRRKINRYADTQPGIHERLQPLYRTLGEAAAVQPELARLREDLEAQRLDGMARFAQDLSQTGGLRPEISVDEARDLLWTLNSHAVYTMLVTDRGWQLGRFRDWLAATLACALLSDPDHPDPGR